MHIELDGQTWRIVEFQHVKPGKGGAFVRTKLKAVDSGKVVERTFRAGETMPRVQTSTEDVQYLYDDGTNYVFMRIENYEQVPLPHAAVADEVAYLKEGDVAQLLSLDDVPTSLQLPASVELVVSQTEPGVKGDTVSNVTKPATLETGAVVQVPLFVNEGDRVKVDTRDGHYLSRA
jgi:elongation factor P